MSTAVTPAVTVNSTPADIAAANAASQQTQTPGQPPATPAAPPSAAPAAPVAPAEYTIANLEGGKVKLTYATGEVFEGTPQEVLDKTARAHVQTKQWAKNQVQQAAQPTVQQPSAQPQSPFADQQEAAVAEYTATLLAKQLGFGDAGQMRAALDAIANNSVDYASQNVSIRFQSAQPDFNPTPENSDKLLQAISEAGMEQAFNNASADQQVRLMQQAHAFLLMTKAYEAKPTSQAPGVPSPPPPAPIGREQVVAGVLPAELQASVNDTPTQIMEKWNKAKAMGYQV